jgi:hypothetical protein
VALEALVLVVLTSAENGLGMGVLGYFGADYLDYIAVFALYNLRRLMLA